MDLYTLNHALPTVLEFALEGKDLDVRFLGCLQSPWVTFICRIAHVHSMRLICIILKELLCHFATVTNQFNMPLLKLSSPNWFIFYSLEEINFHLPIVFTATSEEKSEFCIDFDFTSSSNLRRYQCRKKVKRRGLKKSSV